MQITVYEFLSMAIDNNFDFVIYDLSAEKNIFDSRKNDEISTEIEEMIVFSYGINNNVLEINVNSDE